MSIKAIAFYNTKTTYYRNGQWIFMIETDSKVYGICTKPLQTKSGFFGYTYKKLFGLYFWKGNK